jgi:hypothetical protein
MVTNIGKLFGVTIVKRGKIDLKKTDCLKID